MGNRIIKMVLSYIIILQIFMMNIVFVQSVEASGKAVEYVLLVSTPGVDSRTTSISTKYRIMNLKNQDNSFNPDSANQGFIFSDYTLDTYYTGMSKDGICDCCFGGQNYLEYTGKVAQITFSNGEYWINMPDESALKSTSLFHYIKGTGEYGTYQFFKEFSYEDFKGTGCDNLIKLNQKPITSSTVSSSGGDYGFANITANNGFVDMDGAHVTPKEGDFVMLFYIFKRVGSGSCGDTGSSGNTTPVASGSVDISLSKKDCELDYSVETGKTITADATITNDSDDGQNAIITGMTVKINGKNQKSVTYTDDNAPSSGTKEQLSTSLDIPITKESISGISGTVTVSASGTVTLKNITSGNSDTDEPSDKTNINVSIVNRVPDVSFTLKPSTGNNGLVGTDSYIYYEGDYYNIQSIVSDWNNDIDDIELSIYTAQNGIIGSQILSCTTSGETSQLKDIHVDNNYIEYSTVNVNDYEDENEAQIDIKNVKLKSGKYIYRIIARDGRDIYRTNDYDESYKELINTVTKEGTFNVSGKNVGPTAIITSNNYAIAGEPYRITQGATDPNGKVDIKEYSWTLTKEDTTKASLMTNNVFQTNSEYDKNKSQLLVSYIAYHNSKGTNYESTTTDTGVEPNKKIGKPIITTSGNLIYSDDEPNSSNYNIVETIKNTHGYITFADGTAGNKYRLHLQVTDRCNNSDETESTNANGELDDRIITVLSKEYPLPIAGFTTTVYKYDGTEYINTTEVKTNRAMTFDSSVSQVSPDSDAINKREWTVKKLSGSNYVAAIKDTDYRIGYNDTKNTIAYIEFKNAGKYKVELTCKNGQYDTIANDKNNQWHQYLDSTTTSTVITAVEDTAPVISSPTDQFFSFTDKSTAGNVSIIGLASCLDTVGYTDWFKSTSGTDSSYEWTIAKGSTTDVDIEPTNYTDNFKTGKGSNISFTTNYMSEGHNVYKITFKATEYKGEQSLNDAGKIDNKEHFGLSSESKKVKVITNWTPSIDLSLINQGNSIAYETIKLDNDTTSDENYIKAYVDDTIQLKATITDESPSKIKGIDWELKKKVDGSSTNVTLPADNTLPKTAGSTTGGIKITENGIYELTATVTDDCGDTANDTILIRIYPLPQASITFNNLNYGGGAWTTRENLEFTIMATDSDTKDDYGPLWHKLNNKLDDWSIKPINVIDNKNSDIAITNVNKNDASSEKTNSNVNSLSLSDIHIMNMENTDEAGKSVATSTNIVKLGSSEDKNLNNCSNDSGDTNNKGRAMSFTDIAQKRTGKTLYEFTYTGTNEAGKKTQKFSHTIEVADDLPPDITVNTGTLKFYREQDNSWKATIKLNTSIDNKQAVKVYSHQGDLITSVDLSIGYDKNNNGTFSSNEITGNLSNETGIILGDSNKTYVFKEIKQ